MRECGYFYVCMCACLQVCVLQIVNVLLKVCVRAGAVAVKQHANPGGPGALVGPGGPSATNTGEKRRLSRH